MHMHIRMNLDNQTTLVCTAIIEGQAKSIFLTWKQCAKGIPNQIHEEKWGQMHCQTIFLLNKWGEVGEGGSGVLTLFSNRFYTVLETLAYCAYCLYSWSNFIITLAIRVFLEQFYYYLTKIIFFCRGLLHYIVGFLSLEVMVWHTNKIIFSFFK
jgi:hypothetical protein